MNSLNSLSAMTGLPAKAPKKPARHRPKKKPGSEHIAKMTQAHGAGDHAAARSHAFNYLKATNHLGTKASSPSVPDMDPTDDSATPVTPPAPANTAGTMSLAALMRRGK